MASLYERDDPSLDGFEREVYDAVSRQEPWALVERFADLDRVSGTADERAAADYLTDRLDALGIAYDRHDPELYLSRPDDAALRVTGPDELAGPLDADLVPASASVDVDMDVEAPAVKTVAFSGRGTVTGELAVADALLQAADETGPGLEGAADDASDDVDDLLTGSPVPDVVAGRVVVLEGILPIETIRAVEARGAAAVVVVHPHPREPHEGIATPVWGGVPDPDGERRSPSIPVVTVARPLGDRLYELAERESPVFLEVTAETDTGWDACPVVVAEVPAGDPVAGDEDAFVLLHGHYDSWHAGVADNATGDATLLECARVFDEHRDRLRRDLRVAWWPGHSTGRYAGSTWYADTHATALDEHCVAHVNVDSPGAVGATDFEDMVTWMPEADTLCRDAIDDVCGKATTERRPPRAGDYSFSNLGVTGLFMLSSSVPAAERRERGWHAVGGCGGNADAWHLTTDTLDKADPDVLVRDTRVYAVTVARLCRPAVVPLEFGAAVDRGREIVAEYDAAADEAVDLAPVTAELDALAAAIDRYRAALDEDRLSAARANDLARGLSRGLVRANFVTEGRFEHDPAVDRPPYPALAPAREIATDGEQRARHTALRRDRNRVIADLRAARRRIERTLATPAPDGDADGDDDTDADGDTDTNES